MHLYIAILVEHDGMGIVIDHEGLFGRGFMAVYYRDALWRAGVAVCDVHCVLRVEPGRGDLGIYRRGVPELSAQQGAGRGKCKPLGDEHDSATGVSDYCGEREQERAVYVLCCDDGGAVCGGSAVVSGDAGAFAGGAAEEVDRNESLEALR